MVESIAQWWFSFDFYWPHRGICPVLCLRPRSTRNCGWAADLTRWRHKFWRTFKWILNCLIVYQSQTRPKCTIFWARKLREYDPCRSPKNLSQPQERSCRGAAKSLNTALDLSLERYLSLKLFFQTRNGENSTSGLADTRLLDFHQNISRDSTLVASLVKIGGLRSVERSTCFVWQSDWHTDNVALELYRVMSVQRYLEKIQFLSLECNISFKVAHYIIAVTSDESCDNALHKCRQFYEL